VRSDLHRIEEVPFAFAPRHSGESKSTLREGLRYLRHLVHLRRAQRTRGAAVRAVHLRPAAARALATRSQPVTAPPHAAATAA
jgi:hypothetical protein